MEDDEETIEESSEDLIDNDEVSPEEEAFMRGYDEAEEEPDDFNDEEPEEE